MSPRRPKRRQMCPNDACEHFQEPTGVLGGCECGTALVPFYVPPTDTQLENFIYVLLKVKADALGLPDNTPGVVLALDMIMGDPDSKAEWLKRHRELQESVR